MSRRLTASQERSCSLIWYYVSGYFCIFGQAAAVCMDCGWLVRKERNNDDEINNMSVQEKRICTNKVINMTACTRVDEKTVKNSPGAGET